MPSFLNTASSNISLVIYFSGVASTLAVDIIISGHFDESIVAKWAEVRSLIGLVGIFCLIGLDQVIVRSPSSSARLLKVLLIQIPLLALPVALTVHGLGYLDNFITSYFLAFGSAGTVVFYQYFRSYNMRNMAQFAQQGWRIALFGVILILLIMPDIVEIGYAVVTLLILFVGISAMVALLFYRPSKFMRQAPESLEDLYRIGSRFMVTSTFLALALYAEQLLVIRVGNMTDAATYFTHATFFLFPMGIINGYVGFLLGPWVRDNHNHFMQILTQRWWALLIMIICAAALMNGVGLLGWEILSPSVGEPDTKLRLIFAVCSIIITLYQIPSAYNGIFAKTTHHDALIIAQVLSLILAIAVFFFLHSLIGITVTISVAAASLTNWTLRTVSGFGITAFIANTKQI